ncbi:uncharacterized protein CDAR_273751 [Caerostris darwini]|uniref:Uncharacterized protein n=1 Tax=Caerostris darwini TaxID=1538125 RepID=A0AAV4RCH3_9ARAC|nr:uncharacterized protein CDAR_273751 [Caerostris darwini]
MSIVKLKVAASPERWNSWGTLVFTGEGWLQSFTLRKARAVLSVKDVRNSLVVRTLVLCQDRVAPLNAFPADTPSLTKKNTATNTMKSRHKIKSSRKQNWEIRFLQKLNSEIPLISHDSCTDMVHCSKYLQNSVTNKLIQSAKEPEFMKYWILCLWAWLICLNKIECYHRRHLKRDGRTSNPPTPPRSEDKDALKEALQLLNLGKKTLGLNTEDPDLLIKLVESPNNKRKSEEVQKLLQHPKNIPRVPIGKQYLALSGEDGKMRVDNFTNVTPSPKEEALATKNGSDVQDVFKMVMEKKAPEKQGKVFHKITIIETNQLKPLSNKDLPRPTPPRRRRRHRHRMQKTRRHPRQKRSRFSPLLKFFHDTPSENFDDVRYVHQQNLRKSKPEKNTTEWSYRGDADSNSNGVLSARLPISFNANQSPFDGKTFHRDASEIRATADHSMDSVIFPSHPKQQVIENGKRSSAIDNSFDEDSLEKFIDSISPVSSSTSTKSTPKTDTTDRPTEEAAAHSTSAKTIEIEVRPRFERLDVFPPMDRYALLERVLPPLERERGAEGPRVVEVAGIMSVALLCFLTVLIVYRKLNRASPEGAAREEEKQKIDVSGPKVEGSAPSQSKDGRFPYAGMYYYKTVALEQDNSNLEWQSEMGDWLSEIDGKENP